MGAAKKTAKKQPTTSKKQQKNKNQDARKTKERSSAVHKLGELIGNFLENAMKKPLLEFTENLKLYLDSYGKRAVREKVKVQREDIYGCTHDLDFVIEKEGFDNKEGFPVAFIEIAWRAYKKHSKNKVQEIFGAINPIADKYRYIDPFKAVVLSGDFTDPSIRQLKQQNFEVVYIDKARMNEVFASNGLEINYDEETPLKEIKQMIKEMEKVLKNKDLLENLKNSLYKECENDICELKKKMENKVTKKIKYVSEANLCGEEVLLDVKSTKKFVKASGKSKDGKLQRTRISICYDNGDCLEYYFKTDEEKESFLTELLLPWYEIAK